MITTYSIAEKCLYCLDEPDGSKEHVIPEALNGSIVVKNATCEKCRLKINSEIESPLLGYFWKDVRRANSYGSKSRGKKSSPQRPIPQVTFTVNRNSFPFQEVVPSTSHKDFQPLALEGLPAPPFLKKKFPDIPKSPAMNIGAANPIRLNELNEEVRRLKSLDSNILSVSMNFPGTRMGLLPRLVLKIGCGLSWYFHRAYATPECRTMILDGASLPQMYNYARSVPREYLEIRDGEVKSFLVQEEGIRHMYYAFTLLPEVLPHVFFFRTGVKNVRAAKVEY